MADLLKCERCGNSIYAYHDGGTPVLDQGCAHDYGCCDDKEKNEEFDVCQECLREFKVWMKSKK